MRYTGTVFSDCCSFPSPSAPRFLMDPDSQHILIVRRLTPGARKVGEVGGPHEQQQRPRLLPLAAPLRECACSLAAPPPAPGLVWGPSGLPALVAASSSGPWAATSGTWAASSGTGGPALLFALAAGRCLQYRRRPLASISSLFLWLSQEQLWPAD